MTKYLFFDTTWNQILRVGSLVTKEMKQLGDDLQMYGLVFETSGKLVDPSKSKHFFDDYLVTTCIYDVESYINIIKPNVVVFAQNTVPDLAAIHFAQKVGARVVMMQHGLLYDGASLNNVRIGEIFAAMKMAKKTMSYFSIMRLLCKRHCKSFFKLVNNIIQKRENVTTTIQNYFDPPLRGECAFVIGDHWRDYYHDSYGYDKEHIYVMGNHDLDDLDLNAVVEDAICYIPSVHVEDGKVQKAIFVDYLKCLRDSIPYGKKMYIKLHPRSDKKLYTDIFGDNVIYIYGKEIPYVNIYIGHNSSLLSKVLQISGKLILWGFKEEKELFYKDFAYAVCHDGDILKNTISMALADVGNVRKSDIERFSYKNPMGAYKYCATKLLELYCQ